MSSRFLANFAKKIQKYNDASEGEPRPLIHNFLSSLAPNVEFRHEPGLIGDKKNAPDFIAERNGNVVGYIEHKRMSVSIRNMSDKNNREQQERYRRALSNLIYTNGIEWDFYRDGKVVNDEPLRVDRANDREELAEHLNAFIDHEPDPISDPKALAEKMARKTTLLKIELQKNLSNKACEEVHELYKLFEQTIMHGKPKDAFAELYAESITYGMFSARMNFPDGKEFSRSKMGKSLPKNNPFLRRLLRYVCSDDLHTDLVWIIDDLANLLSVCEVKKLMDRFMEVSGREDPFLHFFETFLDAYDPERRRDKGVYYTPQQAVNFVVRATDQVLKEEFEITDGLADISTIPGKQYEDGRPMHKVRVLDPATGTGTFLVETIQQIAPTIKKRAGSAWTEYVENHLIPRLHGFEILMAPYAMCFAKIDMVLKSLEYTPSDDPSRLEIYLNDALDLGREQPEFEGFGWLTKEANLSDLVKDGDKPVMCVIGNPPYKQVPAPEKGTMMNALLEDFKKEPGQDRKLDERNSKHLNDLYLQFMRLSSYLVDKNEEGMMGLITNNSYLGDPTFRGVRYHLQKTFSKIWIVNLHGDTTRGGKCPDGSADFNVFDIKKGVSIIIAVKTNADDEGDMALVKGMDLWGTRESKLRKLSELTLSDPEFEVVQSSAPRYSLIKSSSRNQDAYDSGFDLEEMMPFPKWRSGVVTSKDRFALGLDESELKSKFENFSRKNDEEAEHEMKSYMKVSKNASKIWKKIREEISDIDDNYFKEYCYRPFDGRTIYYTGKSKWLIERSRRNAMSFMEIPDNIAIDVTKRFNLAGGYRHAFCHEGICDSTLVSSGPAERCAIFPLLTNVGGMKSNDGKRYNFNPVLFEEIAKMAKFAPRGGGGGGQGGGATPRDVFDYIYGVLYCPRYRFVYREFLRVGFPRIPWPSSPKEFWSVSEKGKKLIGLHLMKAKVDVRSHDLVGTGDNSVASGRDWPKYEDETVRINSDQCFKNVPEDVWNFQIGNHQPARDWLRARNERVLVRDNKGLEYTEIEHYKKILKILAETCKIMQTIEMDLPGE